MTIFYVDTNYPSALDTNNGLTLTTPVKTITKGLNLAQPGDTVQVRSGTYRELVYFDKSGTSGNPITLEPYNNEEVIVSGTSLLTSWTLHTGNIYKTTVTTTQNTVARPYGNNQILVNGISVPEARFPYIGNNRHEDLTVNDLAITSGGTSNTVGIPNNTTVSGSITSSRLSEISSINLVGSVVTAIPGYHWTPISGTITARNANTITFDYKSYAGSAYDFTANNYFYLYNNYDFLLLGSNQFYHNTTTNELFLWDALNRNPSTLTVEYKNRDKLLELFGRSYITIKNIKVVGGRVSTNASSNYITIQNCTFDYCGHNLFYDVFYTYNDAVIQLYGTNSIVENNTVRDTSYGGIYVKDNSVVQNNTVTNVAVGGSRTSSILVVGTNTQINNNILNKCGHSVLLDIRNSTNLDIYENEISEGGLWVTDEGLVLVARNTNGGTNKIKIHHNRIYNGLGKSDSSLSYYGTSGIYTDGNVSNVAIYRNIIYNTTGSNISVVATTGEPIINVDIINNTCIGSIFYQPSTVTDVNYTGTRIINNIFTNFPNSNIRTDFTMRSNVTTAVSYNSIYAYYYPDPKLDINYNLLADSPLIDKGEIVVPYTDGYLGNLPDIGAIESSFGSDTLPGNNSFFYIYNYNVLNEIENNIKCKTFIEWQDIELNNITVSKNNNLVTYSLIKTNNISLIGSTITITLTDLNNKINIVRTNTTNLLLSYESPYMISVSSFWNKSLWNILSFVGIYQINYEINLELADTTQAIIETGIFYLSN